MVENSNPSLQIDLIEFKLHLFFKNKTPLTLHFDTRSRKFYLSLIALVIIEMKKAGKIKTIPLQDYFDLLVLLNETVGGAAGSSNRASLFHRIYTKWKYALPNLEEAPLFQVLGRKKVGGEGAFGKIYLLTDEEKDGWANLFEYKGSEENVRLKFALDRIGIGLEEARINFGEYQDGGAWEQFVAGLKKALPEKPVPMDNETASETPVISEPLAGSLPAHQEKKEPFYLRYRWLILALVIGAVATGGAWKFYTRSRPIPVAALDRMKYPLPDKPSIAVLPFVNLSGDPKQEVFCGGITEGIIDGLAKFDKIFVIARNSSFAYKGKAVKIKQVAEEMGVRYVIEGSVQQEYNRVRITAQLVDALSGYHLFSERYDRDLKDILKLQDEITMKILTAVQVKLTAGEGARLFPKGTKNLDAYLKLLQAKDIKAGIQNKENVERSMQLCEEAIALDPEYSYPYSILSTAYTALVVIGASESPKESLQRAIELGEKAIALDKTNAGAHANLVFPYIYLREFDKAISEGEKAISLSPNSAVGYWALGSALIFSDRPQEGIPMLQKSLRLSPIPIHSQVLGTLAHAYAQLGQYENAIAAYKKVIQIYGPHHLMAHLGLACTYATMGWENEARAEGAEILRIDPKFSWERWIKGLPYPQFKKDQLADLLHKVGLM
jgi:adenylate cyclase